MVEDGYGHILGRGVQEGAWVYGKVFFSDIGTKKQGEVSLGYEEDAAIRSTAGVVKVDVC